MRPDEIIKTLERAGFEARYVGGCVRDTLLNRPIHDWDIASQALPEDVMHLFAHCVPTGLKHGTVTVLLDGVSAEVTTYRILRSMPWRWTKAARSPICLEDGTI